MRECNPGPCRLNGENFKSSTACSKAARGGRSSDGAVSFGQSVTTFFTRTFGN